MNHSMINALTSMQALQQKLDITANNIANIDTVGYKRREASFEEVLTSVKQQPNSFFQEGRMTPLGYNAGWGVKLAQTPLNLEQGSLLATDQPLDVAIEGAGLFEIATYSMDENGEPMKQTRWTRDGSFQLSVDPMDPNHLYLVTKNGDFVMGQDDEPIGIPLHYRVEIQEDGTIMTYNEADETDSWMAGQMKLVRVMRPQLLEQVGDNLFALPTDMTPEMRGEIMQMVTEDNNEFDPIKVWQGFIEQSNVVLADEMTELITIQRSYQLHARAMSSADQMMNLANNLRG